MQILFFLFTMLFFAEVAERNMHSGFIFESCLKSKFQYNTISEILVKVHTKKSNLLCTCTPGLGNTLRVPCTNTRKELATRGSESATRGSGSSFSVECGDQCDSSRSLQVPYVIICTGSSKELQTVFNIQYSFQRRGIAKYLALYTGITELIVSEKNQWNLAIFNSLTLYKRRYSKQFTGIQCIGIWCTGIRYTSMRYMVYSVMQSDGNSFCGDVVLDSFNMI